MTTLTDLTNKMKSVGKGLQRTSAFPIDKWQLWDSFNDSKTKLVYIDPTTNTSTECDTADELAQLVANSTIAYTGFKFEVIDCNNTSHSYSVTEISSYEPTQQLKSNIVLKNVAIEDATVNNITEIVDGFANTITSPNSISSSVYFAEYEKYWEPENSYNDSFKGFIFKPWLLSKYSPVEGSNITENELQSYYPPVLPLYSITLLQRQNGGSPANVYLSVFEAHDTPNNPGFEFANGTTYDINVYDYTYLCTSDTSARFEVSDTTPVEHEFTFNNHPLVLDMNKRYVVMFTTTNTGITSLSSHVVNTGVKTKDCWGPLVKSITNANQYYSNNRFPIAKFKVFKTTGVCDGYVLNSTFTKLASPNTFTALNTFNNGVQTNTISSTIIDIISADNSNISSVYKLEYQNNNNFGKILNIAATSAANIVIDTYPGHNDDALSVIQYGSTRYIGNNSRASYSNDLPLDRNDNTLATTKFTKSHINSVSSALNTIISDTSSEVTDIVNTVSSFISGEVNSLSSTVSSNAEELSSAISSKIIMRIWN